MRLVFMPSCFHNCHAWPFIYYHGDAQTLSALLRAPDQEFAAPDLVRANQPFDDEVHCGTYDAYLYGTPVRVFIWKRDDVDVPRGLIVLQTDEKGLAYAQEQFDKKAAFL